jgi:hypothetical protein
MLKSILSKAGKFHRQIREARSYEEGVTPRKLFSMGVLGLRCGFSPLEYFLYGFDGKHTSRASRLSFISNDRIIRVFRKRLNNTRWIPILENKLFFFLFYSKFSLPVVKVHGFYHPNGGFSLDGTLFHDSGEFKSWLGEGGFPNLVVKPVGSLGGKGIMIFDEFASTDELKGNDGRMYTLDDVVDFMHKDIMKRQRKEDPYRGYLIEEKIIQDPIMNVLSGASLNSIRISTLMTREGEVLLDFAMLRVGKKGSLTDNLHQGGLVVNINLQDGALDERTFGYRGKEGPWVEEKEVNVKDLFEGGVIPRWDDMAHLAKRAAAISPELRSVGWDIALSLNGPVLMEGNDNWDMIIAQVLAGAYLTPERREILREYGMEFPE